MYYPDVDIPAELIREQIGVEARLEDSLRVFDPLVGELVTSFHVSDGSKQPRGFIAFPMGESGCDLSEIHHIQRDAGPTLSQIFRVSTLLRRGISSLNPLIIR